MTPREKEVFDFIAAYIVRQGYSPSYDEIVTGTGEGCKSGVHRVVISLEEQGRIRRNHGTRAFKHRCIVAIPAPLEDLVRTEHFARMLVASLKAESINEAGEGTVTVDAKAFGDLDVALTEASGKGDGDEKG